MLHRNPAEFQTGGLVVDLYRLVHRLFLCGDEQWNLKKSKLVGEVFSNRFSEVSIPVDDLNLSVASLVGLFLRFIEKAGLSLAEFHGIADPVNPDICIDVLQWWSAGSVS